MSIVGNGPMFRDEKDFADDRAIERAREEYRRWLETPKGQEAVEAARAKRELYHRAACVFSQSYRSTQAWIEAVLMGQDCTLPQKLDFGSAEEAIVRDMPEWKEQQKWFSH